MEVGKAPQNLVPLRRKHPRPHKGAQDQLRAAPSLLLGPSWSVPGAPCRPGTLGQPMGGTTSLLITEQSHKVITGLFLPSEIKRYLVIKNKVTSVSPRVPGYGDRGTVSWGGGQSTLWGKEAVVSVSGGGNPARRLPQGLSPQSPRHPAETGARVLGRLTFDLGVVQGALPPS